MATYADVKGKAKLPTRSVPLYLGDLQQEFEDLERELQELRAMPGPGTLAGSRSPQETELAERIESLRLQMQEDVTVFRLRAMTKKQWRDLKGLHAPRQEDRDEGLDYNDLSFPVAVVARCCVDPQMTVTEVEELVDEVLTEGQWDTLYLAAFMLNRRSVDVPSSIAASAILANSKRS